MNEDLDNTIRDDKAPDLAQPDTSGPTDVEPHPVTEEDTPSGSMVPRLSPLSFMLILASGLLFLATLCPTVYVGDAGDFITACCKGWIPHPPGYPVYTILGHLLTLIPTPFCVDSVSLKRFVTMLFLSGAGIFGVIFIIRNRETWGKKVLPYIGYIIGAFIGILLAKTIHAFMMARRATEEAPAPGFDLTEPASIFFGLTVLLFFTIVFLAGFIGTRSRYVRPSTYIVSIIFLGILTPLIYLMVRNLIPPTIDPIDSQQALKVNLLSAIAGFLTVVFAYLTLREIIPYEPICGISAFLIGIGRTYWAQATIAEVYTLNTAFIFVIFYLGFSYIRTRKEWRFYLMALLMGIALAHHYSILLFYPGLLYYMALKTGGISGLTASFRPVKRVLIGFILVLIGMIPYAYLSWVHYESPLEYVVFSQEEYDSLRDEGVEKVRYEKDGELSYFVKISSRGVYTEARKHARTEANLEARTTTPQVFGRYIRLTMEEFTIPIALFALLGFLFSLRFRPGWLLPLWLVSVLFIFIQPFTWSITGNDLENIARIREAGGINSFLISGGERLIWFLTAIVASLICMRSTYVIVFGSAFLFYFGVVHFYPSEDILNAPLINLRVVMPPLVVPLHALMGCFVAFFVAGVYHWIKGYNIRTAELDETDPGLKTATFRFITIGVFLILTLFAAYVNYPYGDKSKSLLSYNYARNVLDSCEPFTVVMTTGDEIFIYWYLQEVEGYRPDIQVTNWIHNIYGLEELGNEMDTMAMVIDRFIRDTTPTGWKLVSTYIVPSFLDYETIHQSHVVMDGLIYRFEEYPPPGYVGRPNLGELPPGDRMNVVDEIRDFKLSPSGEPPLSGYYWGGINPLVDSSEFTDYEKKRVLLDPQEDEMLRRYQDTLLHAGINRMQEGMRFDDYGEQEMAQRQYKRALAHFRSLVSLDPFAVPGWLELGETYLLMGYAKGAVTCFNTLLTKKNASDRLKAEAHGSLAMMLYQMGDYDSAKWEAEQAYILDAGNPKARFVRNQLMKDTGGEADKVPEETGTEEQTNDE